MSNASLTPAGGWYADPTDAAQLRWWDGVNWTLQTTPATAASATEEFTSGVPSLAPVSNAPEPAPAPAAPEEDGPGVYIPRNSVFKMAEAVDGQAYVPEWSGIADISDEVALSGVPVQLALTATPNAGPPIPVSAAAFPILGVAPEPVAAEPAAPAWQVEQPLAKPIDQLFPPSGPAPLPTPTVSVPVAPVPATIPVPAAAAAFSIAVSHAPAPVDTGSTPVDTGLTSVDTGSTLSSDIFPAAAHAAALSVVPAPTGALYPGLVPDAAEPVEMPMDAAPVAIPVLAAVPDLVEDDEPEAEAEPEPEPEPELEPVLVALVAAEPVVAEPVAAEPVAAEPVAAEPVVAAIEPAPVAMAPAVAEEPANYEPLVARAIPQPVMFPAQPEVPAPVAPSAAPSAAVVTPGAGVVETPWPTAGTYQPHPGVYVPFDPKAVHVQEPVMVIPFSSRDPFNPASTSRPALRSYGAAPVGPNGSTYTPALAIILLIPLLIAGGYALLFQLATINVGLAPNIALAALLGALFFVGIGAAQFDRNTLAKRGYFDLASPFWILLSPLVYLGVRASRLHSQGTGGIRAVFLWFGAWAGAAAILAFSTFAALAAVTPDRVAQTERAVAQHFVVDKVVPTVNCPNVPSFAVGTVFNCIVTAGTTVQLVQVTIADWTGAETYELVPTSTTAATAATTAPTTP